MNYYLPFKTNYKKSCKEETPCIKVYYIYDLLYELSRDLDYIAVYNVKFGTNALVTSANGHILTDSVELLQSVPIDDLISDEDLYTIFPSLLHYRTVQSTEMCENAIKKDPDSIKFVKDQTESLCELAIKKDPNSIRFVKKQLHYLCMMAIEKDPHTLQFMEDPHIWLVTKAISLCQQVVKYIKNPEEHNVIGAVAHDGMILQHLGNCSNLINSIAVKSNPNALQFVKTQTCRLIYTALKKDITAVRHIKISQFWAKPIVLLTAIVLPFMLWPQKKDKKRIFEFIPFSR